MSLHPVDVHVGKRLRLRRSILGISQETLGELVGVTFQQIQKYERGINRVSASRLFELSKVLQTTVAYFFEGYQSANADADAAAGVSDGGQKPFALDEAILNREAMELIRAYNRIPDAAMRKQISDLVKAIAAQQKVVVTETV